MILEKNKYGILLEKIKKRPVTFARLNYYLHFKPEKFDKIWCDAPNKLTVAIAEIKPNLFHDKKNALIWAEEDGNFEWLRNWKNEHKLQFRCVPDFIYKKVQDSWELIDHFDCDIWYLPEGKEIQPPKIKTESIRIEDIEEVNQNWGYATGKIRDYVQKKIEQNETVAIYIDGKMASYAIFRENGSMGMLRTLPEFRGQGFAKEITKAMAKRARAKGWLPHCFVVPTNVASQKVVISCGFVKDVLNHWFIRE